MEFISGNRIKVDPPKKPKKLTATRFATILGLNAWATPFAAWCEMTRTYEEPFSDSIYTVAGKIIEPKVCEYLRNRYFMDIQSPTDVYGTDYFRKTWGDFFPDQDALGGMWDFKGDDFVVEVKTTKRAEDWRGADGKVEPPIYYKLQAALYAYLLGFDDVVMTCSFLEAKDYPVDLGNGKFDTTPTEAFTPNVDNTVVVEFKVSEAFPTFKETYVDPALRFWRDHVMTGISPAYDEKKDAEILKALRKNVVEPTDADLGKLIAEADKLTDTIADAEARLKKIKSAAKLMTTIAESEARLKEIGEQVKKALMGQFRPGDKKVETAGKWYTWTVTKAERASFDAKALAKDLPDVHAKYAGKTETYTLKKTAIEEV